MAMIPVILAAGFFVGWFFQKKHVPAGMMIGAVVAALAINMAFHVQPMPSTVKNLAQVIAGTFIGCSTSREDLRQLKTLYKPVAVVTVSLLAVNFAIGFLLYRAGYSDLLTCLICAVPGGISDMTLIAVDFGADASRVLLVHFSRLVVGVIVFPLIVQRFTPEIPAAPAAQAENAPSAANAEAASPSRDAVRLVVILAAAFAAAWVGRQLHVPAASILFSLLSTFVLNLCGFTVRFPKWLRRVAQVLSGTYVGCLLDLTQLEQPLMAAASVLITVSVLLVNAFLFGKLLEKLFKIPLREGMLILTPAGASDMALISADIGVSSPRLVLIQIYRLLIATAIFPQICLLVSRLF